MYSYIRKILIFLVAICIFSSLNLYSQTGSLVDSIQKEILSALSNNNINLAISRYNDLYSVSYKENKKLLENICNKIIEHVFNSKDIELKNKALEFIEPIINFEIAKVILKSLNNPETSFREKAIKILSKYNNEILYPEISSSLKSNDLNLIISAIDIIKNIKQSTFASQIIELFEHEDLFVRVSAIKALANLNPNEENIKKLNELLKSPSEQIRSAVIETFLHLPSEYANIENVIGDSSENVQLSLLKWAEINPGELADSIIRRNIYSKNMEIFSAACKAAIKSEDMIERIDWTKLTTSIHEDLRILAVKALNKSSELFDDEDVVKAFLNDSSIKVRIEIAGALLKSKEIYSESILKDVFANGSPKAKEALLHILGNNLELPCENSVINNFFNEDNAFMLTNAIPLLKRLNVFEQKTILHKLLNSNKINVRSSLFKFVINEKNVELYNEVYNKGLKDSSVSVQIEVIKGFFMLNDSDRKKHISEIYNTTIYKKVREECVNACLSFEKEDIKWEWVDISYKDEFPNVRQAALNLAKNLEDKDRLLELFSDALFDSDENVRSYALKELQTPGSYETKEKEELETKKEENINKKKFENKDEKSSLNVSNQKKENKTSKLSDWLNQGKKKEIEKIDLAKEDSNKFDLKENTRESKVEKKLKELLTSGKPKLAEQAEDVLLELKDEASILNIKNRLFEGNEEERKKAAEKLGYLNDTSLIPVLREQLKRESNLKVQFELAFAIWKMLPNIE